MSDGDKNTQADRVTDMNQVSAEAPEVADVSHQKTKTKRAKTEKSDQAAKPKKSKSDRDPSQPRAKRGPARPHRRLEMDVIDSRIAKLQRRLDRAKSQLEDAGRHVEEYLRERDFRAKDTN